MYYAVEFGEQQIYLKIIENKFSCFSEAGIKNFVI